MAFADSANKQAVREQWNLPLLRAHAAVVGQRLTYFGMPGPRMLDLLAWRSVLEERRTAVEEKFRSGPKRDRADDAANQLVNSAIRHGLSDGLQVLRGDVGVVLTRGYDDNNARPSMSDQGPAESSRFRYNLHNIDFDGGLAFLNKLGEAPRLDALRKLVERQRGCSFILLLTVNVRNTVGKAITDYLDRLSQQPLTGAVAWYLQRGDGEVEQRLKAIVPVLLGSIAQSNGFALRTLPPLAYTGSASARMMNFSFEFRSQDLVFAGVNQQTPEEVLLLPMFEARNGAIALASTQHPSCVPDASRMVLSHLQPAALDAILKLG